MLWKLICALLGHHWHGDEFTRFCKRCDTTEWGYADRPEGERWRNADAYLARAESDRSHYP